MTTSEVHKQNATAVREELLTRQEVALLDIREEALHAEGHPLFAANLPLSRLELEAYTRLPRRNVNIVLFGQNEECAHQAALKLIELGYTDVKLLSGGLQGWIDAGFEVFIDVNAPSKAFGELVEATRHTPSLTAETVQKMIDRHDDYVIVDVRRYDEFQTMSIPSGVSVPGGELVLRIREMLPSPKTQIIINCAGRTRGIIGTQSLINASIPNPVAALRNGTIGWKLAQQQLAHGASERFPATTPETRRKAADDARSVADKAGVLRLLPHDLNTLETLDETTIYRFDVRTLEEYERAHLPGFLHAPGGQLVQETDMFAPVRGAWIILADDDGVRANMTASWLAQMGWRVSVLDALEPEHFSEIGPHIASLPALPPVPENDIVSVATLNDWLNSPLDGQKTALLDFTPSHQYRREHIPGAWFALRSDLQRALETLADATRYVITSTNSAVARFAYADLVQQTSKPVFMLYGVNEAWRAAQLPLTSEDSRFASLPIDRYQRPYEGTSASSEAMQAYLDWEFGLVAQLERDGTHHFQVL